jgi:uncharacterized lipoprotein YmbA
MPAIRPRPAALIIGAGFVLAACGSDPQPANVVVVPPAQAAPPATVIQPAPQATPLVVPPGSRVICSDGRMAPC